MLEFQQKRKLRKILYSPISLIALAVVAVVLVRGAWNVYEKESASRNYLDQARTELTKVTATQQDLAASVAALQTQQGVEADIRHKFRVVKPGEQIAVIVDNSASDSTPVATSTSGFWAWVTHFF
ncbi:MAG: septum formation initiator family protein [bacterium]